MTGLCNNPTVNSFLGPDEYQLCGYQCIGLRNCGCCLLIFITFLALIIAAIVSTGA